MQPERLGCRSVGSGSSGAAARLEEPPARSLLVRVLCAAIRDRVLPADCGELVASLLILRHLKREVPLLHSIHIRPIVALHKVVKRPLVQRVLRTLAQPQRLLNDTRVEEGVARLDAMCTRCVLLTKQIVVLASSVERAPREDGCQIGWPLAAKTRAGMPAAAPSDHVVRKDLVAALS